jgi:hypothetical protein
MTDGQPYYCELWVEAGGMLPQGAAVAGRYGITTYTAGGFNYTAGGFNGLTDKYETASRIAGQYTGRRERGQITAILDQLAGQR